MRVLDIDLDFFLDKIARDEAIRGRRLKDGEFKPWTAHAVREFLETNCGLSTSRKIPGKYVEHHDEAFYWWRELIRDGKLSKPFEVVHVDAHADLGVGTFGHSMSYVCFDLLHQPVADRENPNRTGLHCINAGNYLLVAIACRWLNRLVYVMHPKNNLDDCEDWLFSDWKPGSWTISLPKLNKPKFQLPGMVYTPLEREPEIEFVPTVAQCLAEVGDFDFIVLCQSPDFTPPASDVLVPVIQGYMDLAE